MQSGQFFELDKTSYLHKGEVVFRYTKVKSETFKPSYPIYISFKSTHIDFYYHGYVIPQKKQSKIEEDNLPELLETSILSLPLSTQASVVNDLNSKLETIFEKKFPETLNYQLEAKINNNHYPAYTNLKAFYLPEKKNTENILLLRVLLLDFIFDMQHTDLFKACPFYENAQKLLQENLFFEAIASKAKFYYLVENAQKNLENNQAQYSLPFDYNSKNEFKGELDKSMKRWLGIIQKTNADKTIDCKINKGLILQKEAHYWFKNAEDELLLSHQYYDKIKQNKSLREIYISKSNQKQDQKILIKEQKDTLDLKDIPKIKPLKETLKEFWKRFSKQDKKSSLDWLLDRYNLYDTIKILFPKTILWLSSFFVISLALVIFINQTYSFSLGNILEFCYLFFFLLFVFVLIKRFSITFSFKFIIFNLIIILVSSWMIIFDIDTLRNEFFKATVFSDLGLWIIVSTLLLTFALIYGNERELRPTRKIWNSIKKSALLLFLAFFYSFNVSYLSTHIFAAERLSQEYFLENFWGEVVIADSVKELKSPYIDENYRQTMDTVYLLINEYDKITDISIKDKETQIKKSKNEILYYNLDKAKLQGKDLPVKQNIAVFGKPFDFFPALVFFNAFLSLFIGIFIQIIISRKPITG